VEFRRILETTEGLKVTATRLEVAQAVFTADGPVSALSLTYQLNEGGRRRPIGYATVYRTLHLLADHLLVDRTLPVETLYQACES